MGMNKLRSKYIRVTKISAKRTQESLKRYDQAQKTPKETERNK